MARTIRRKHYLPSWVVTDSICVPDLSCFLHLRLEGEALKEKLCWWHQDNGRKLFRGPKKSFRKAQEVRSRVVAKNQLDRFWKNPEHEVLLGKIPYPYWD